MLRTLTTTVAVALLLASCGKEYSCKTVYNWPDANQECQYDGDILVCTPLHSNDDVASSTDSRTKDGTVEDQKSIEDQGAEEAQSDESSWDVEETLDADTSHEVAIPPPNGEMRGIWVSRWDFDSEERVRAIIQDVADNGFNAVFFQVRGVADAYYHSNVEPWSAGLSGTLGEDPGWDPLAVAIDEAHTQGLELHAWVNTMSGWSGTNPPPTSNPPHVLYQHPEWRVQDSSGTLQAWNNSYVFLSPGIPGVRAHIEDTLVDLAENYDVDGIHLDYIRYPGPQFSHDEDSVNAYESAKANQPDLAWEEFQRNLLTEFVSQLSAAVWGVRPAIKMTAAVWGIYQDKWNWGGVSQGYFDYYQDSHRWIQDEILDAICPMTYWPITQPAGQSTDFTTLASDHLAAAGQRHVYMGIVADYDDVEEIENQILHVRAIGGPGNVVFSYSLLEEMGTITTLHNTVYTESVPVPTMPWK